MTIQEALTECLTQTKQGKKVTKYRIAKVVDVEPIMIDRWLRGDAKSMRKDVADSLLDVFGVQVDDHLINGQQKRMTINHHNELVH